MATKSLDQLCDPDLPEPRCGRRRAGTGLLLSWEGRAGIHAGRRHSTGRSQLAPGIRWAEAAGPRAGSCTHGRAGSSQTQGGQLVATRSEEAEGGRSARCSADQSQGPAPERRACARSRSSCWWDSSPHVPAPGTPCTQARGMDTRHGHQEETTRGQWQKQPRSPRKGSRATNAKQHGRWRRDGPADEGVVGPRGGLLWARAWGRLPSAVLSRS